MRGRAGVSHGNDKNFSHGKWALEKEQSRLKKKGIRGSVRDQEKGNVGLLGQLSIQASNQKNEKAR